MRKVVSQYSGSSWVVLSDKRFVYDGWNLVEEQTLSPASSRFYIWGLDLSQSLQGADGIGGLLATVSGATTDYFLYDGNGNVGQLVNASGGVIDAQYEYDPYGNLILSTGTLSASNPFRFSTKYLDAETGLYYYGYRYYDPKDGRWLTRDPIEEDGGLNLYAFVKNSPLNHIDPDGEIPLDVIWDIGNIVFDIVVGDNVSLAADVAAFWIPYVPAGSTKLLKIVKTAKAKDVVDVCKNAKKIEVSYEYYGVVNGFKKHTLPKSVSKMSKWWKKTKNSPSKFNPGWGDDEIKNVINNALKDVKNKGKIKPGEIDGYIFDTRSVVGASNGKLTSKIKIHINSDGTNLHAFPIN